MTLSSVYCCRGVACARFCARVTPSPSVRDFGKTVLGGLCDTCAISFSTLVARATPAPPQMSVLHRAPHVNVISTSLPPFSYKGTVCLPLQMCDRDVLAAVEEAGAMDECLTASLFAQAADGLLAWCRCEFDVPVAIEQWSGHWMPLAKDDAHAKPTR